jgi:serine/threonine protein kinase
VPDTSTDTIQIKCPGCSFVNQRPNRNALRPFSCSNCPKILIIPGKLGDIFLTDLLGTGGMGTVYKGFDPLLHRQIAVKLMKTATGKAQQTAEQYIQEARAQAKVNHPNVAQIFSAGIHNDAPYIVMEFIDGGMLSRLISPGSPLPEIQVVEYAIQICKGLRAAYKAGITHRDIKPSNILLDKSGEIKIVDFGLAGSALGNDIRGVGTATYIAPENIIRDNSNSPRPDHRADMYSLGVTLYELLASEPPFKGKDSQEKMQARFKGPPKNICIVNNQVHLETSALINRLLKVDPAQRFDTYDQLIKELEDVKKAINSGPAQVDIFAIPAEDGGANPLPPQPITSASTPIIQNSKDKITVTLSPLMMAGAAIATLAVIGLGGYFFFSPSSKNASQSAGNAFTNVPPPPVHAVAPLPTSAAQTAAIQQHQPAPQPAVGGKAEPAKTGHLAPEPDNSATPAPKAAAPKPEVANAAAAPHIEKPTRVSLLKEALSTSKENPVKGFEKWDLIQSGFISKTPKDILSIKVPNGDFTLSFTMAMSANGNPQFLLGREGNLGMATRTLPRCIFTTGVYGIIKSSGDRTELPSIPTDSVIAPDKPFQIDILHTGDTLTVYLIGKDHISQKILSGPYPEEGLGYVRLYPGTDPLKLTELTLITPATTP